MQKLLAASLLLASCALQPAAAQKAPAKKSTRKVILYKATNKVDNSLPTRIEGEFLANHNRHFFALDIRYRQIVLDALYNAGFEGTGPAPLAWELARNTKFREVAYKSIYDFVCEYVIAADGSTQTPPELVFVMLTQELKLSSAAANTLTKHIMARYHHSSSTLAKVTGNLIEVNQQDEPSPSEEAAPHQVATYVEQMPSLPGGGGMKAIVAAIQGNLRYPAEDKHNKTEGRVLASFTVDEAGQAGSVKILQGLSSTINAEAVRAIEALPKFTPGKQNGRAVAVSFTVPLHFRLPTSTSSTTTP